MQRFFNYIHNLQKRPREERKRFALLTAGTITGIIFLIWLSARLSAPLSAENAEGFDSTPFQSLGSAGSDTYNEIKGAINSLRGIQKQLENLPR